MERKAMFKTGDLVKCVVDGGHTDIKKGGRYMIGESDYDLECIRVSGLSGWWDCKWFELVLSNQQSITPTQMLLSKDANERKGTPITTGVLDYFPLAIAAVAVCSKAGNDQHHPNTPLAWDKQKSTDHADCIARHLIDRSSYDTDGILHAAKLAWRALALLQIELEKGAKVKCQGKDCKGNEWNA
jgi:hypothetical protein